MSDKWDTADGHTHSEHGEFTTAPNGKHNIVNHDGLATGSTLTSGLENLPHVIQEVTQPAQKPSIGRIVHYVLPDDRCAGEHRPAIITKIWPKYNNIEHIQLQVFTDGLNDGERYKSGIHWATSVEYADPSENKPHSWHWPERV